MDEMKTKDAINEHFSLSNNRVNTLKLRQNGHNLADNFKCMFLNENISIWIKISPKFVPKGLIDNIPALVHKMASRQTGNKPLSEPLS